MILDKFIKENFKQLAPTLTLPHGGGKNCLANKVNLAIREGAYYKAFTLAEVLITLGIIGVVSAITMPTLIQNYKKQKTVNQLKQAYSTLYQAIKLSELDNGHTTEWEYPEKSSEATIEWIKKYIAPYLKYTSIEQSTNDRAIIKLSNGNTMEFWNNNDKHIHVWIGIAGTKNVKFIYFIGKPSNHGKNQELRPYDSALPDETIPDRDYWLNSCKRISAYCSGLIMFDNWQIKDDYPQQL